MVFICAVYVPERVINFNCFKFLVFILKFGPNNRSPLLHGNIQICLPAARSSNSISFRIYTSLILSRLKNITHGSMPIYTPIHTSRAATTTIILRGENKTLARAAGLKDNNGWRLLVHSYLLSLHTKIQLFFNSI